MRVVLLAFIGGVLGAGTAWADVRVPTLLGDHMVLQRDSRIVLWGWAEAGERVRIQFHSAQASVRADRAGRWSTSLGPFPAGGPYELIIAGHNRLVLHDILLGDVWLASGQSNMEAPLGPQAWGWKGVNNAEREVSQARFPQIRLFKLRHQVAPGPVADAPADSWVAATPQTAADFSGVAFLFGRELHQRYGVPIGLIEASWGGTVAEAWMSAGSLTAFPQFRAAIESLKRMDPGRFNSDSDPNTATLLFNGMIAPLVNNRIKGVIWYQGEGNADRPVQYRRLFPALIQDWRRHWGYGFPFLFVQLAGFGSDQAQPAEYPWAELREAQSMTLAVPVTGMATAVDVGDEQDIHPRDKQTVAHRLVLAAARVAYGEDIIDSGPVFKSMRIEGTRIRLEFASCGAGLAVKDRYGYLRGFQIAGKDGKFVWAQARLDGQDVVVFSERIASPAAVRYDWSNTPDGNLFNSEGLPAIPFRTDAPQPD